MAGGVSLAPRPIAAAAAHCTAIKLQDSTPLAPARAAINQMMFTRSFQSHFVLLPSTFLIDGKEEERTNERGGGGGGGGVDSRGKYSSISLPNSDKPPVMSPRNEIYLTLT